MKSSDVEAAAVAYLEATGGNVCCALEAAIADLFDAQREAAFRNACSRPTGFPRLRPGKRKRRTQRPAQEFLARKDHVGSSKS